MKNTILSIIFMVASIHALGQKKIDAQTFKDMMAKENTVVLDVRTQEEYSAGHIKGAQNFNYFADSFVSNVAATVDKKKTLLVYCAAGGRSAEASKALKKAGYKSVYDLIGGYDGWK